MKKFAIALCATASMMLSVNLVGCSSGSSDKGAEGADSTAVEQAEASDAGQVVEISTDEYIAKVADIHGNPLVYVGSQPCIVDFWATWCGPCVALTPVLHEIAQETGITVYKVNVDQCGAVADAYGIQTIPALFICKDGKVTPYEGKRDKDSILDTAKKIME
ncbi:MAG: conjugal transfer protein TraF [Bacteroidales bacterium]|nr:conjugal transfer protein TraF [Bacteroidales bacterium]